MGSATLEESEQVYAARTMVKLLEREEDLKAALLAASKGAPKDIGALRTLLAEARELRLLVESDGEKRARSGAAAGAVEQNQEQEEGEEQEQEQEQEQVRCMEVDAAVAAWAEVEGSLYALRRLYQLREGANIFGLPEVLRQARELGVDQDNFKGENLQSL